MGSWCVYKPEGDGSDGSHAWKELLLVSGNFSDGHIDSMELASAMTTAAIAPGYRDRRRFRQW